MLRFLWGKHSTESLGSYLFLFAICEKGYEDRARDCLCGHWASFASRSCCVHFLFHRLCWLGLAFLRHILQINTSQRQIDQLFAGQIQKSLHLKVLKGICGNGKCSKDTLPRSHVTAKDSSSQLTTRHSHNKWCDERLAWTQCHAGHICFPRAYLHVSAHNFNLNSLCMHKSAPNYIS